MKKLIILIIIIVAGVMVYLNKQQDEFVFPEFDDEFNQIVCVEEHLN